MQRTDARPTLVQCWNPAPASTHTLHTYPVLLAPHWHTPPGRCDAAPGVDSVLGTRYSVLLLLVGIVFPLEVKDGRLVRVRVRVWVKVREG